MTLYIYNVLLTSNNLNHWILTSFLSLQVLKKLLHAKRLNFAWKDLNTPPLSYATGTTGTMLGRILECVPRTTRTSFKLLDREALLAVVLPAIPFDLR